MNLKYPIVCGLISLLLTGCDSETAQDAPADPTSDLKPSKRSDIHGAIDPATGVFVVFGGDDGPIVNQRPQATFRDDTWIYEPVTGWSQVTATGPSPRGKQSVAFDSVNQRMLVFGGRFRETGATGTYTHYNDVWAFDISARTWEQLSDGTNGPSPRYFSIAAFDAATETLYLYGGDSNPSALSVTLEQDVWSFKEGVWTQITTSGALPSPARLYMGYTHDTKRNALIGYGGQIGDFVTAANADLYSLDLASGVWTLLDDGSKGPDGRFSSLMTYDELGDRYLMMGGHVTQGVENDLWSFDPNTSIWTQLYAGDVFTGAALGCLDNPRELPKGYVTEDVTAPERRSGGFLGHAKGQVWLFGGESDCSDHLNDTWRYDLSSSSWVEVLAATSGESCLRENNDCQCLCL